MLCSECKNYMITIDSNRVISSKRSSLDSEFPPFA